MKLFYKFFICSIACFINTYFSYSQGKKEQIIKLRSEVDSLNKFVNLLQKYNNDNFSKIQKLEDSFNKIDKLNKKFISKLKSDLDSLGQKLIDEEVRYKNLNEEYKNRELKEIKINHDCNEAVGNALKTYPVRTNGLANGCIGLGCEEIPSDGDLHKAILLLDNDYNSDGIVDIADLAPAIVQIGDINGDSATDIYDIVYPEKIKYTSVITNPFEIKCNFKTTYDLIGRVSSDGKKIILNAPIDIISKSPLDPNGNSANEKRAELFLSVGTQIVIYKNKTVVLRGKLLKGVTQEYGRGGGYLFLVDDIIGVVIDY